MDKIVRICLGILMGIFLVSAGSFLVAAYTETAYRNTLSGTYLYTCKITTDAPLYNVTLFIPVPVDPAGNSPMAAAFSSKAMNGVPADWETTLFDTGKSTLLKVKTPAIIPPRGTTASTPYTITFSSETTSRSPVDTRRPVEKSAMFRPVQDLHRTGCPQTLPDTGTGCFAYTTAVYADYTTAADTTVTITSAVTGRNTWKIFELRSNEYHTETGIMLRGENHGWVVPAGQLISGIGSYDIPGGT